MNVTLVLPEVDPNITVSMYVFVVVVVTLVFSFFICSISSSLSIITENCRNYQSNCLCMLGY